MKKPLIILAGPTAVGKTSLSIQLAKALNGEIVSADSMQVYRHMDIGSAKVTKEEMGGVSHHLIDVLEPWEPFDAARFQAMAKEAMEGIYARGRLPVVVGGTGFYIQALLYDVDFEGNGGNEKLRRELEALLAQEGAHAMHQMLQKIDPAAAMAIHENNQKRVIRAIEYYRMTGQRISEHNERERAKPSPYEFYYYVLACERARLYERIDQRVDEMIRQGLIKEVQALKKMGLSRQATSMQGLGYKEMFDYLDGKYNLEEAVRILKRDTRHFAKRQLTWFRRERGVRWLWLEDYGGGQEQIVNHICGEVLGKKTIAGGMA